MRMLEPDPNKRITIPEALNHPWFKKYSLKNEVPDNKLHDFYDNVMSFKTDPQLFFQHATYAYIVHNLSRKEDITEIRKLFLQFDKNGLGRLTTDEIVEGLRSVISNSEDEKRFREILNYLDQGQTGIFEYEGKTYIVVNINLCDLYMIYMNLYDFI